jgi:hypothetical protein
LEQQEGLGAEDGLGEDLEDGFKEIGAVWSKTRTASPALMA